MNGRISIVDVTPVIAGGAYPAKSVIGEQLTVGVTAFREGHDAIGVNVVLRDPTGHAGPWTPMRLVAPGTDRYEAVVAAVSTGAWTFQVEAWGDPVESWRHDARIKIPVGQDVELVLEEGARLHERAAASVAESADTAAMLTAVTMKLGFAHKIHATPNVSRRLPGVASASAGRERTPPGSG